MYVHCVYNINLSFDHSHHHDFVIYYTSVYQCKSANIRWHLQN